ncbi:MAG: hypothetical protein L0177_00015, partial [Chloroflexi bacterium]|nr:hypothetical protein [Chloroflexota bacterium]
EEATAATPSPPLPPLSPRQQRRAAVKSARTEAVATVREAMSALHELFGAGGRLGAGLTFDEDTYAKALPHLRASFAHFQALGQDLRTIVRSMIAEFGDGIRPYLQRLHADVQSGDVDIPVLSRERAERAERQRTRVQAAQDPARQEQIAAARATRQQLQAARRAERLAEEEAFEASPEGQLEMQLLEEQVRARRQAGRRARQERPEDPERQAARERSRERQARRAEARDIGEALRTQGEEAFEATPEGALERMLLEEEEQLERMELFTARRAGRKEAAPRPGAAEREERQEIQHVLRQEARQLARRQERLSPQGQARIAAARARRRGERVARAQERIEGGVPGGTEEGFDPLTDPMTRSRGQVARGGHPAVQGTTAVTQFANGIARHAALRTLSYDIAQEIWINTRLMRPITHVTAQASNTFMTMWAIPEEYVAVAFRGSTLEEANALAYGTLEAYMEGLQMIGDGIWERYHTARRVLEHGGTRLQAARSVLLERRSRFEREMRKLMIEGEGGSKIDVPIKRALSAERVRQAGIEPGNWTTAIDVMGEMVRLPGRALGAADDFSKIVNYRAELKRLAMRLARSEGTTGADLQRRIFDIINHPRTEEELQAHAAAMAKSIERVFQAPRGGTTEGIMQTRNKTPFACP